MQVTSSTRGCECARCPIEMTAAQHDIGVQSRDIDSLFDGKSFAIESITNSQINERCSDHKKETNTQPKTASSFPAKTSVIHVIPTSSDTTDEKIPTPIVKLGDTLLMRPVSSP